MAHRIHLIDPDYRRRAKIFRKLEMWDLCAEDYGDFWEFSRHAPLSGIVFAADDAAYGPYNVMEAAHKCCSALPIVVYAPRPSTERVVSTMLLGAMGYLKWPFDPEALFCTFERTASEGARRTLQKRQRAASQAQIELLTPRERQVLMLIVEGNSNKHLARVLQISPRTVEIHRGNMMRKLNAQSAADAVRIALYAGLDENFQLAA